MKRKIFAAVMCLVMCLAMCLGACAQTADLEARFSEGTIEVNGETYRLRKRLSSTLFICTEQIDDVPTPGFMGILTTEDNEKVISVVYLDPRMLADPVEDAEKATLADVFAGALENADAKAGGAKVLETVNALIGETLIEDYIVFDVAGLDEIEGLPAVDVTGLDQLDSMKARLKNAKNYAENLPSGDLTDLIGEMSAYLHTEMKSGALIKIADKAERYAINPSVHLGIEPVVDEEGEEYISVEGTVLFDALFNIFYEVNPYWQLYIY